MRCALGAARCAFRRSQNGVPKATRRVVARGSVAGNYRVFPRQGAGARRAQVRRSDSKLNLRVHSTLSRTGQFSSSSSEVLADIDPQISSQTIRRITSPNTYSKDLTGVCTAYQITLLVYLKV